MDLGELPRIICTRTVGNCEGQTSLFSHWKAIKLLFPIYQIVFCMNRGSLEVKKSSKISGTGKTEWKSGSPWADGVGLLYTGGLREGDQWSLMAD